MALSGAKEESDGDGQNISAGADGVAELLYGFSDKESGGEDLFAVVGDCSAFAGGGDHFVDEKVETINDASFGMQWDFQEGRPARWTLRDKPAVAHNSGANFAFADGHVETKWWMDRRTIRAPRDDAVMASNEDILWMQRRATWRER